LDLVDAGKRVSARTRAIMPVHPFGMPADIVAISQLASKHGLLIIEDAACALGASREGISCGNGGNTGCFSFHPRKLVTTGEGGAIATTDEELSARLRLLRSHGAKPSVVGQEFLENGFNYRLSEISASLGLAQLHRFAPMIDDRRRTAQAYQNALSNFEDILMPQFGSPGFGTFQSFVVLLGDHVDRNHVVKEMRARKVETTLGTYAQHSQPAFARFGCLPGDLPHSLRAQRQSLTLPLLPHMGMEPVHYVVDALVASIHASYRNPSDETV